MHFRSIRFRFLFLGFFPCAVIVLIQSISSTNTENLHRQFICLHIYNISVYMIESDKEICCLF